MTSHFRRVLESLGAPVLRSPADTAEGVRSSVRHDAAFGRDRRLRLGCASGLIGVRGYASTAKIRSRRNTSSREESAKTAIPRECSGRHGV